MKKMLLLITVLSLLIFTSACEVTPPSSDAKQQALQEKILEEGTAQTGMPAIKNFRERKLLKDIIEMRDQEGLTTFTYLETYTGTLMFLCNSIGYGIPAATQYTNPSKVIRPNSHYATWEVLPQADPNGLFSPASAEGTWVMCIDTVKGKAVPVYVEPRVIVSPFKMKTEPTNG